MLMVRNVTSFGAITVQIAVTASLSVHIIREVKKTLKMSFGIED